MSTRTQAHWVTFIRIGALDVLLTTEQRSVGFIQLVTTTTTTPTNANFRVLFFRCVRCHFGLCYAIQQCEKFDIHKKPHSTGFPLGVLLGRPEYLNFNLYFASDFLLINVMVYYSRPIVRNSMHLQLLHVWAGMLGRL